MLEKNTFFLTFKYRELCMSFLNPSLRLTTLNDLMKFSQLTGTDSSVFAIMKIGVLLYGIKKRIEKILLKAKVE